jgi:FkbM family methyltransferase
MLRLLKKHVVQQAAKAGYTIQRTVSLGTFDLDVFDLAVRVQMSLSHPFRFLQVGANDGITFDPIREYVLQHGWSGVLMEPQPVAYARLLENYAGQPGLEFVNAALSEIDGTTKFFTSGAGDDVCAGLDARSVKKHRGEAAVQEMTVATISPTTLLEDYALGRLDLLQVDVEGFDCKVTGMLLDIGIAPAIIRFEYRHVPVPEVQAFTSRLNAAGYRLAQVEYDIVAVLGVA